jgi:DNA-binding transcriptional ArsR family regulator
MITAAFDSLVHVPTRLRIMATLASLRDGDALSFNRLKDMIGLTPGNLSTHLIRLENADYVSSGRTVEGPAPGTSIALTRRGRSAFDAYDENLRTILSDS